MSTRLICLRVFLLFAIGCLVPDLARANPLAGVQIRPEARVSYDRRRDYGDWMRMNAPYNRCFNVRDQVLADESTKSRFRFKRPARGKWRCTITAGSWRDPYTATRITQPSRIDIDHVVPLKEAHLSGAHRWPKEKRQEYANYLRDPNHLIAVAFSANRSKGDKDPARWMPPNGAFQCKYLTFWVAIKSRWELSMDRSEAAFVRTRLATC